MTADLSLLNEAGKDGGDFGASDPLIPCRADDFGRKLEEVLIEPSPIDRRWIEQRLKPADLALAPNEEKDEPCRAPEQCGGYKPAKRERGEVVHRIGTPRARVVQQGGDRDVFPDRNI